MNEAPQTEQAQQAAMPSDFGLRPEMTVEVLTMENRLNFLGKVDSFRNGAVILRDAKGDELPIAMYNKEVKLRFFQGQGNTVLYGKVCGSTRLIWKVDRLENKFVKEQRAFFRQRISPNTAGLCSRRAYGRIKATRPAPCQVLDISAGGVLIVSKEEYQVGDRLSISGVHLVEADDAFSFVCQVRRAGEKGPGEIPYGCQFETLPPKEQDRLLRAIFVVQREEIRRQKEREGL